MATLAETKTALYLLFAQDTETRLPVAALTKVANVYRGEPRPGDGVGAIWMSVNTSKGTPLELEYRIVVYANPNQLDALDDLDTTIQQVWTILEAHPTFVIPGFTTSYAAEIDRVVAVFNVTAGRSDL